MFSAMLGLTAILLRQAVQSETEDYFQNTFPVFRESLLQKQLESLDHLSASHLQFLRQRSQNLQNQRTNIVTAAVGGRCGILDSCVLRCGDSLSGPPYICSCDSQCVNFQDCCFDALKFCPATTFEYAFYGLENSTCKYSEGLPYYGYWHTDDMDSHRLCAVQEPPWCEAEREKRVPMSFSILLKFGPAGWFNNLLYSSDHYSEYICPNAYEIWDPFSDVCRPVQCGSNSKGNRRGKCVEGTETPTNELFMYETTYVNITVLGTVLSNSPERKLLKYINRKFLPSLATKIGVSENRFEYLTVAKVDNQTEPPLMKSTQFELFKHSRKTEFVISDDGFPVQLNFTLKRSSNSTKEVVERELEEVLSILNEAVAMNTILKIEPPEFYIRLNEIQRWLNRKEHYFFEKWCRGGDLEYYWNEDFDVVFFYLNATEIANETVVMRLHIYPTDVWYEEGEYISNILYQSSDLDAIEANVSGVVVVCENRPCILDMNCTRIALNDTQFIPANPDSKILIYTGEIKGIKPILNISDYYYNADGAVVVCVDIDKARDIFSGGYTPLARAASWISFILLLASLVALLLTILVYIALPQLRNPPGWCLVNFCTSDFVFFALFVFGVRPSTGSEDTSCMIIAICLHFFALSIFTWSTVISYDLHQTFTNLQIILHSKRNSLARYVILSYSIPAIIVFAGLMVEFYSSSGSFRPDYGLYVCWIGNSMFALYFFAIPIAISLLANFVFFAFTIRAIRQTSASVSQVGLRAEEDGGRFKLFARMSSIMCFAWVFGFLAVGFQWNDVTGIVFEFIFIVSSALQGVYVFATFVLNARVKGLLVSRICGGQRSPNSSVYKSTGLRPPSVQIDQKVRSKTAKQGKQRRRSNPVVVERSVSNETCVSNLSM